MATTPTKPTKPTRQQEADKIAAAAEPTKAQQQAKAREAGAKPDYPNQFPLAGMTIKGEGKANARLFQTSPDVKEYLTQSEAEAKGFYWKEDPADDDPKKAARQDKVTPAPH